MSSKKSPIYLSLWACGLLVLSPQRASASGFPVVDLANLGQSILQVTNSLKQILNQLTQIQQLKDQIDNQIRELKTLDSSSWDKLTGQLVDQMDHLNQLFGQLTVISYRTDAVQKEFHALFPKETDWSAVSAETYSTYAARWHTEVLNAALTAMNAQGSLTQLVRRNAEIASLLSQSADADGVVRQLQLVNEMLAVHAGHITDMASALMTTARMTSTATAHQASQERMTREAALRARRNYTYMGKEPKRLTRLPRFK